MSLFKGDTRWVTGAPSFKGIEAHVVHGTQTSCNAKEPLCSLESSEAKFKHSSRPPLKNLPQQWPLSCRPRQSSQPDTSQKANATHDCFPLPREYRLPIRNIRRGTVSALSGNKSRHPDRQSPQTQRKPVTASSPPSLKSQGLPAARPGRRDFGSARFEKPCHHRITPRLEQSSWSTTGPLKLASIGNSHRRGEERRTLRNHSVATNLPQGLPGRVTDTSNGIVFRNQFKSRDRSFSPVPEITQGNGSLQPDCL